MLSSLLSRAGLRPPPPDELPEYASFIFPADDAPQGPGLPLSATYIYRSRDIWRFPHRLRLRGQICRIGSIELQIGDRITVQIIRAASWFTANEFAKCRMLEAWVIGVHFDNGSSIEFSLLGVIDGILQIVFLEIPRIAVCSEVAYLNTTCRNSICYWTYMPSAAIEYRAKLIQGVGDDLSTWSPRYLDVHELLLKLRTRPIGHFVGLDPAHFGSVSGRRRLVCSSADLLLDSAQPFNAYRELMVPIYFAREFVELRKFNDSFYNAIFRGLPWDPAPNFAFVGIGLPGHHLNRVAAVEAQHYRNTPLSRGNVHDSLVDLAFSDFAGLRPPPWSCLDFADIPE